MRFMLDTNSCIYLIKKKPPRVIQRLKRTEISDVCISAISLSELEYGVEKSEHRERNQLALAEFLAPLEVMSYDDRAAAQCGLIRARLERGGLVIGPPDLLIAAHALVLNLILVTNNDVESKRVPGLNVAN